MRCKYPQAKGRSKIPELAKPFPVSGRRAVPQSPFGFALCVALMITMVNLTDLTLRQDVRGANSA